MSVYLPWAVRLLLALSGLLLTLLLGRALAIVQQPLTENSVGQILLAENKPEEAMHVFSDSRWQAVALYRAGRFNRSIGAFSEGRDIRSLYNIGNAYAQLGRYDEAVAVFEDVISEQPEHEDARFNLELVRKAAALARKNNEQGDSGLANNNDQGNPEATDQPADESQQQDIIQTVRNQPTDRPGEEQSEEEVADDGDSEQASAGADAQSGGQSGKPGEENERQDVPQTAASLADDDNDQAADLPADSLTQQRPSEQQSMEDDMADEILLRHIKDRPKVVLKARLRMALKRVQEAAAQ